MTPDAARDAASVDDLLQSVLRFRDARDWKQFHTPRNLILALVGEVGELAQLVRWVPDAELARERIEPELRRALEDEFADVTNLLLLVGDALGIDMARALEAKLARNERRYPVERAYGSARKAEPDQGRDP